MVLPPWVAVTVQVPAVTILTVEPDKVQTVLGEAAKPTANPEVLDADRAKVPPLLQICVGMLASETVWPAFCMVTF